MNRAALKNLLNALYTPQKKGCVGGGEKGREAEGRSGGGGRYKKQN